MLLEAAIVGGTLVAMVPTSAGLVMAADSRITIGGRRLYCDNVFKIVELDGISRTAFIVTGHSTVWNFRNVPLENICNYIQSNPAAFDVSAILKSAIERTPSLASANVEALPQICVDAVNAYAVADSKIFDDLRGKQIFQVALGSYDEAKKISVIRSFSIDLSKDGAVSASELKTQAFRITDEWQLVLFGEGNYLTNQVFNGVGIQFLGERYARFRNGKSEVHDADPALAADFVSEIIEAASKTTALILAETGIGGPVDVLLLGEASRPQRLKWKSQ
jgi:hypothetical protein